MWGSLHPASLENSGVRDALKSVNPECSETSALSSFRPLPEQVAIATEEMLQPCGPGLAHSVHKKEPTQSFPSVPGCHSNRRDAPALWTMPCPQCAHRKDQLSPFLLLLPTLLPL